MKAPARPDGVCSDARRHCRKATGPGSRANFASLLTIKNAVTIAPRPKITQSLSTGANGIRMPNNFCLRTPPRAQPKKASDGNGN